MTTKTNNPSRVRSLEDALTKIYSAGHLEPDRIIQDKFQAIETKISELITHYQQEDKTNV